MPNINLSFTASAVVVVLLVFIAAALTLYFYRRTVPPISSSRKAVLMALRWLALSLLLMFLFEPLLRFISSSTQQPVLAVLIDDSKSMTIADKRGERSAQLRAILKQHAPNVAGRNAAARFYSFGGKTQHLEVMHPDSLRFAQEATDLSAALRTIAHERQPLNIGAVLVFTDGSYSLGQNPIYEAEQFDIPIYAVGIGDSTEQKDLLVTKVVTNELVYNQTEVPVDVTIKSSGFNGEKAEVVLAEGGKELGRASIVLQEGTREYGVRLNYLAEGDGVKKYSVRVSRLPGELTTANNQRTFLARVLKSKQRIVLVAGAPSPDVSVIGQTLREERNFDVRSLTQKSASSFYEGQLAQQLLDSADCLVLVGFPTAFTSGQMIGQLKNAISKRTIPVLFVGGVSVDPAKLSALNPLLPFTIKNHSVSEQSVFLEPAAAHTTHPILSTNTDEGIESWKRLPPIYMTQTAYQAKPEATVLASTKINAIVLNDPLMLIRNVNRQKSLALLGYGIWRWRLMAQGNTETETMLQSYLTNSIRWLTTRDDSRPVRITPTKDVFSQGEPIEFIGQVYDASANPVENAQVKLVVRQEGGESETTLRPIGNGRYEGTLEGLTSGDYSFRATATADGQPIGEDKGRFTVGELALEFQDTRMNVQLLRQLAARTGGEFFTAASFDGVAQRLSTQESFVPRIVQQAQEFELWNWKYMLALVVLLFAVEWFLRKRSGML